MRKFKLSPSFWQQCWCGWGGRGMPSFEFICDWFKKAAEEAKRCGKKDSALLWEDGLAHLEAMNDKLSALEEVLEDKRRLTRELDIAMNGEEGAAKQASLCDLIKPARQMRQQLSTLAAQVGAMRKALLKVKVWLHFFCRDIGTDREPKMVEAVTPVIQQLEESLSVPDTGWVGVRREALDNLLIDADELLMDGDFGSEFFTGCLGDAEALKESLTPFRGRLKATLKEKP